MLGDNQAMYRMVTQEGATSRTRYSVLRAGDHAYQTRRVDATAATILGWDHNMIADLITKALEKGQFFKLRDVMMNHHAQLRDALSIAMCRMHGSASRLAGRALSRQL